MQPKHLLVADALRRDLLTGKIKPASVLPGERLLAKRFEVSYMTCRRAIELLVAEGLCERRGQRTLATPEAQQLARSVRLNLLCFQLNTFSEPLIKAADQVAHQHGWLTQLTIVHGVNDRFALQAIASGEPCLFLLPSNELLKGRISRALEKSHAPIIIVGNNTEEEKTPWVKADDKLKMRLAINHLQALGHQSMLFTFDNIGHSGISECLEEWTLHEQGKTGDYPRPVLRVNTKSFESRPHTARRSIKNYFADHPSPSAIICDNDELALGVLQGLRDLGLKVPEDVSILSFGNTILAEYASPSLTVMDVQFDRHIRIATDLIANALNGQAFVPKGHIIRPRLIKRESTAPVRVSSRT